MAKKGKIYSGWGSVEVRDSDGELLPMQLLKKSMPSLEERDIPIMLGHGSDIVIGRLLDFDFRYNDEVGEEGIWLKFEIYDDYPSDEAAEEMIDKKETPELSIGGQYQLSENGTATWIAPMTWAVVGKGASQGATIEKKDGEKLNKEGDGMTEEKKDAPEAKDGKMETPEKKEEKPLEKDPGTEQKEEAPPFDAKAEHENLKKVVDEHGAQLSRILDLLDSLLEEEEKEHGTDAAITHEEAPKDTDSAISFGKEEKEKLEAQHSKMQEELIEMKGKVVQLEAQLSKALNTGVKHTVQSGGQAQQTNEMEDELRRQGFIS